MRDVTATLPVRRCLSPRARDQVIADFARALRDTRGSGCAAPPTDWLMDRARKALDDVAFPPAATLTLAPVGTDGDPDGVDPDGIVLRHDELAHAAGVLFEVAFPAVRRELRGISTTEAAAVLHRAIMGGLARDSLAYLSLLQSRLHDAQAQERRRMARELHDRVAHTIGAALQCLELAREYAPRDQRQSGEKFSSALTLLRESLDDVRQLSGDFRSSVGDDDQDLKGALEQYLARIAPRGVVTRVVAQGDGTVVPAPVREEVFVVLREALRNALLHAEARAVSVVIDVRADMLRAAVSDDGRGFDPSATAPSSQGVTSMRERTRLLGGSVAFTGFADGGTSVDIRIPLSRNGP